MNPRVWVPREWTWQAWRGARRAARWFACCGWPDLRAIALGVGVGLGLLGAGCATGPRTHSAAPLYDAEADGAEQVTRALERARAEGKHVLVVFGANWCTDCQALHRLFTRDRRIRQLLAEAYVTAYVDTNRRDGAERNVATVARYENPIARGIPALLVLDESGAVLNITDRLRDDAHREPATVRWFLERWVPRPGAGR